MLQIDTISRNKSIFNPNRELQDEGVGIWDLTRSSVSFNNINLKIQKLFMVDRDEEMRPDLICMQAYGSTDKTGSLMKVNGISNPFAVGTGSLFMVPVEDRLDAAFEQKRSAIRSGNTTTNPNTAFLRTQQTKSFKVSESRKKFVEAQNKAKNPVSTPLPPNVLQPGEVQTFKTNEFISLGPSTSAGGPNPAALPF